MKVTTKPALLLFATVAVNAQTQCPIDWNNPADQPDNPGYVDADFSFNGTGQIHMHSGCTYWRQGYPRDITRDSVGCLNDDGHVVPIDGESCATFHYVGATGKFEDYEVEVFRNVKNNYICGWDFSGQTEKWLCADESKEGDTFTSAMLIAPAVTDVNPFYYFADYVGGEISTEIFTFYIQHPPTSADDAQSLEFHIPDNPYSNQTFLPGDGRYPVIMELVVDSL